MSLFIDLTFRLLNHEFSSDTCFEDFYKGNILRDTSLCDAIVNTYDETLFKVLIIITAKLHVKR